MALVVVAPVVVALIILLSWMVLLRLAVALLFAGRRRGLTLFTTLMLGGLAMLFGGRMGSGLRGVVTLILARGRSGLGSRRGMVAFVLTLSRGGMAGVARVVRGRGDLMLIGRRGVVYDRFIA